MCRHITPGSCEGGELRGGGMLLWYTPWSECGPQRTPALGGVGRGGGHGGIATVQ